MCVCVYVENTAMASSIKMICLPVCACVHVGKIYQINVSIVGWSQKDKKLTLLSYMCMHTHTHTHTHTHMGKQIIFIELAIAVFSTSYKVLLFCDLSGLKEVLHTPRSPEL